MAINDDGTDVVVDYWSVQARDLFAHSDIRLDAKTYNPSFTSALEILTAKGIAFRPLRDLASVTLRTRFTRIWAADHDHGLPYFNTTDLLNIFALGFPSPKRFLSFATKTNIEQLIVRKGWLLMTCSGTVGRVFYVPERLDGWAGTHDIVRIIAYDADMTGYLYAWLSTPIARRQVKSYQYSTQIDHLTAEQVGSLPVPMLDAGQRSLISHRVMRALVDREKATEQLTSAWIPL